MDWLTYGSASDERVSGISWRTTANRIVIDDFASRANAAGSRAGISAFLVTAGFVPSAVGVDDAFRSA